MRGGRQRGRGCFGMALPRYAALRAHGAPRPARRTFALTQRQRVFDQQVLPIGGGVIDVADDEAPGELGGAAVRCDNKEGGHFCGAVEPPPPCQLKIKGPRPGFRGLAGRDKVCLCVFAHICILHKNLSVEDTHMGWRRVLPHAVGSPELFQHLQCRNHHFHLHTAHIILGSTEGGLAGGAPLVLGPTPTWEPPPCDEGVLKRGWMHWWAAHDILSCIYILSSYFCGRDSCLGYDYGFRFDSSQHPPSPMLCPLDVPTSDSTSKWCIQVPTQRGLGDAIRRGSGLWKPPYPTKWSGSRIGHGGGKPRPPPPPFLPSQMDQNPKKPQKSRGTPRIL